MKTYLRSAFFASLALLLFSCKDQVEDVYTVNEPIYMSYEKLRGPLKVADGQDIHQPGKIYFKDNYIFVNEYQKGIHVIDNADPASPEIVKFIEIPGNVDIAIKGNILYADSYVDLVAIDISNLEDIKEVGRLTEVFPYILPELTNGVYDRIDESQGVVTGWKATEKRISAYDTDSRYSYYKAFNRNDFRMFASDALFTAVGAEGSGTGTGGSMARFTVYDKYLYTVDAAYMRLFDLSKPEAPVMSKQLYIGWEIETMFPYQGKLFLGSRTGMYIYSIANPADPRFLSMLWHATGCDPVVVEDTLAWVTIRSGNMCGTVLSQLDVINIADLRNPVLLKEYPMEEPYGLGIDDKVLFICDGDAGIKIYDATDPLAIDQNKIKQYSDIHAWDVIPLGDVLLMIGSDGLYQYDYSNINNIKQLSIIPIEDLTTN